MALKTAVKSCFLSKCRKKTQNNLHKTQVIEKPFLNKVLE